MPCYPPTITRKGVILMKSGVYKYNIEYMDKFFKKFKYILIDNKIDCSIDHKLNVMCSKGHNIITTFHYFKRGIRCKICYSNSRKKLYKVKENHPNWKGGVTELGLPLFETYASQLNWCEETRRDPNNKDLLQVRCTEFNCRKWFTPTLIQVWGRNEALKSKLINGVERRFYCSDRCKKNCSIFRTQSKFKQTRINQAEWAKMVKDRDSHICQLCGDSGITAHHIESLYQNPIESADIDNGITLCKKCDNKVHSSIECRPIDLTKENICKDKI
jgi:hypothetical protein